MSSNKRKTHATALDLTTSAGGRKRGKDAYPPRFVTAEGKTIVPRLRFKAQGSKDKPSSSRGQPASKDNSNRTRPSSNIRHASQQLGSPALNSMRLVPIPDLVLERIQSLNRFDSKRGPLGVYQFGRGGRVFGSITAGLVAYAGAKPIAKRPATFQGTDDDAFMDPVTWLFQGDGHLDLTVPLPIPSMDELLRVTVEDTDVVLDYPGRIVVGPTADDIDWGPCHAMSDFLLTNPWAQTVADEFRPLEHKQISTCDPDLSEESLAAALLFPCPSEEDLGFRNQDDGALDLQEEAESDSHDLESISRNLIVQPIDISEYVDDEAPSGANAALGQAKATLLKLLLTENEAGYQTTMPPMLSVKPTSEDGETFAEFDAAFTAESLFEASIQTPLPLPASTHEQDEDMQLDCGEDELEQVLSMRIPVDEEGIVVLSANVSLSDVVQPWLLDLSGRDVFPRELKRTPLVCHQEDSFHLSAPSTPYIDMESLGIQGVQAPSESLLACMLRLLKGVISELDLSTRPLPRLDKGSSSPATAPVVSLSDLCDFGEFEPLHVVNVGSLTENEMELAEAFSAVIQDAYDADVVFDLGEDMLEANIPIPMELGQDAAKESLPQLDNTPLPALELSQTSSSLVEEDLLGTFMGLKGATHAPSSRNKRRPDKFTLGLQKGSAAALPSSSESDATNAKDMVPRILMAAERLLELNDDLVLELLDFKLTLVDAPFLEVDLVLDERTGCCLLGLGDLTNTEDPNFEAMKLYIRNITEISSCFETIVLVLIGDPIESRDVIRKIHLSLINFPIEIIVRTCQDTHQLCRLIRRVTDESIRRREERMTYDQDLWLRSTRQTMSQAAFLSSFPSINYWVAALMLSSLPLRQLLSSPAETLISMFPGVPRKWLVDFAELTSIEWREPVSFMEVAKDEEADDFPMDVVKDEYHQEQQGQMMEEPARRPRTHHHHHHQGALKAARVGLSYRPGDPQTRISFYPIDST